MHLALRSGRCHSLVIPDPESVTAEDIAVGLARLCRFSGHTREFYSVAQHSVLVAWLAQQALTADDRDRDPFVIDLLREDRRRVVLAALLHDAHEVLWGWGDIARPALSAAPLAVHEWIEQHRTKHDVAVARAFGIAPALFAHPTIRRADDHALAWEFRDVMEPPRFVESDVPVVFHGRLEPIGEWDARHAWLRALRNVSAGDPIPQPHFLRADAWPERDNGGGHRADPQIPAPSR